MSLAVVLSVAVGWLVPRLAGGREMLVEEEEEEEEAKRRPGGGQPYRREGPESDVLKSPSHGAVRHSGCLIRRGDGGDDERAGSLLAVWLFAAQQWSSLLFDTERRWCWWW